MDLKIGIIFSMLFLLASCEVDYSALINSTQMMQDFERGGVPNIYPQLNPSENSIDDNSIDSRAGGSRPFYFGSFLHPTNVSLPTTDHPFSPEQQPPTDSTQSAAPKRPFYAGSVFQPTNNATNASQANEKFLNETRSKIASGLCTKEVPTASLLRKNQLSIAGNGSDPSLSLIQICCEGYQRDAHIFRKCNPICSKGCPNGICTAPETCTCYPQFAKNFNGQCIQTCPKACENGVCVENTCRCNEGFELEPNGKFCSLKCKEGFRAINGVCQPFCSRGCENGQCVAPEQCECRFGWTLDASQAKCVPKCDRRCLNGFCSGPNTCLCNSGYMKDIIDQYHCNPVCNPPCENAICSQPNMCLCRQGYIKDPVAKNRCVFMRG